jgi:hypothetical protein
MRNDRLAREFESLLEAEYLGELPPFQLTEMRRVFFAGASAAYAITREIGRSGVSEGEALDVLAGLCIELERFSRAVRAGKA